MGDAPITRYKGKPQIRRTNAKSFTAAKRQRFFDALALTCNVTKAAAFAGVGMTTVFRERHRDAAFSARWDEALAMGYDRLEALMLEHGGAGQPIDPDPDAAEAAGMIPEPFDFERAMKVLTFRRNAREGRHGRPGPTPKHASREETNAALMKLLAAARRRVDAARERGEES